MSKKEDKTDLSPTIPTAVFPVPDHTGNVAAPLEPIIAESTTIEGRLEGLEKKYEETPDKTPEKYRLQGEIAGLQWALTR